MTGLQWRGCEAIPRVSVDWSVWAFLACVWHGSRFGRPGLFLFLLAPHPSTLTAVAMSGLEELVAQRRMQTEEELLEYQRQFQQVRSNSSRAETETDRGGSRRCSPQFVEPQCERRVR